MEARLMLSPLQRRLVIVAAILVVQGTLTHVIVRQRTPAPLLDVNKLPIRLGSWVARAEQQPPEDALALLQPSSFTHRSYRDTNGRTLTMFAGYFRDLGNGPGTPGVHSPKVCLPGAGWLPVHDEEWNIPADANTSLRVNRTEVEKGRERVLVLYWYQNRRRTWTTEFTAKMHLLPDALSGGGPEVTLVRIATPWTVREPANEEAVRAFALAVYRNMQDLYREAPLS